jgi:hypothetical protein
MIKNYHKCDCQTLIVNIAEVITHLENGVVTGLDPHMLERFSVDLRNDLEMLIVEESDAVQKRAAAAEATALARARHRDIATRMTRLKYSMMGSNSPTSAFETIFGAPHGRRPRG